jgi:hypothetical protein
MSAENSEESRRKLVLGGVAAFLLIAAFILVVIAIIFFYWRSRQLAVEQANVQYVLDASSRMNVPAEGGTATRLEVARSVLGEVVRPTDPDVAVGLRLFGAGDDPRPCFDTSLLVPLGQANQERIVAELQGVMAGPGPSPDSALAQAIVAAIRDLAAAEGGPRSLVVITGGEDACQLEAAQLIAQEAARVGIELRTFVIGFQVTAEAAQAIKAIADSFSEGYYLEADDDASLALALQVVQTYIETPTERHRDLLKTLVVQPPPPVDTATPTATFTPTPVGLTCRNYGNPLVPITILPGKRSVQRSACPTVGASRA